MPRRQMLALIAAGAGALAVGGVGRAGEDDGDGAEDEVAMHTPGSQLPQWVSWDDGMAYPIHDVSEEGWIVNFDEEGFFFVDPAGYVCDEGVWYPVVEQVDGRFWYSGDDGYEYQLETQLEIVDIDDGEGPF